MKQRRFKIRQYRRETLSNQILYIALLSLSVIEIFTNSPAAEASELLRKVRLESHEFPHCGNNIHVLIKNETYLRYNDNSILNWIPKAKRLETSNKNIYQLLSPRGLIFNGSEYFAIDDSKLKDYNGDTIVFTKNGKISQVVIRLSSNRTAIFLTEFECMIRSGVEVGTLILKAPQ